LVTAQGPIVGCGRAATKFFNFEPVLDEKSPLGLQMLTAGSDLHV
jgi:hypothetical protein